MRPLPLSEIKLTGGFWQQRQNAFLNQGLEAQYLRLVETGRIENFRRAASGEKGTHRGLRFDDSDVYKWAEACAYALLIDPKAAIKKRLDEVIEAIAAAQEAGGYLNTFFQLQHPRMKWRNLGAMHEMYCAGHLIEAGVAHFEATGERKLLDVAIRFADHIGDQFGHGKRRGYCGHQELEIALIRLAEATGNREYRKLAAWMVDERGKKPSPFEEELKDAQAIELSPYQPKLVCEGDRYSGEYLQDHAPLTEHTDVVGHAVRAMYLYVAATELLDEHPEYINALNRGWANLTEKRMYVTGGIGPSEHNEGFTVDYDLPNRSAYAETCASVALVFWARRMLEQTGDSKYADVMERALYNGCLSGVSLDTTLYFYTNPLESRGEHARVAWFTCACCPPNIARLVLSVSNSLLSVSDEPKAIWLHIPASLEAEVNIGGEAVKLAVESEFPWNGLFSVRIEPEAPTEFELRIRLPEWVGNVSIHAPEGAVADTETGYMVLRRTWKAGDKVEVGWEMPPKFVHAHPKVLDDLGRIALTRGPLVYCLEEVDFGKPPQLFAADSDSVPLAHWRPDVLGGVASLEVDGKTETAAAESELYRTLSPETEPAKADFVPYYAWNNRGPNGMMVWLRNG